MNKISLDGFAMDKAPKWVSKKSRLAWAHGAAIVERRGLGATLQELADEYGVTAPTISRILKLNKSTVYQTRLSRVVGLTKQAEADQIRIAELKAELDTAKAKADHNEWAYNQCKNNLGSVKNELHQLKGELSSRLNWKAEASETWALKCQAEQDRDAAEAQIEMMAERLAECRGRGFWARVFNR